MPEGNKTLKINYRFLETKYFAELYRTSLAAFSDYLVPIKLTELQFENHIAQNAVDLTRSVGAFFEDKMIGYTLNGFGWWKGKQTAYDAGTGVIPEFRNKGIGTAMFGFLLPYLRENGIKQMLLEVVKGNEVAIGLYRKLGFEITRNLLFFEAEKPLESNFEKTFEIREIENPDWDLLKSFWDGHTSWQFSPESVERKLLSKIILGAFLDEKCVGYSILYPSSGMIPQIAIDQNFRKRGIGSGLVAEMHRKTANDRTLRFSNVDSRLTETIAFFKKLGFSETISQFEMVKTL